MGCCSSDKERSGRGKWIILLALLAVVAVMAGCKQ
jgi:hypothetical protein